MNTLFLASDDRILNFEHISTHHWSLVNFEHYKFLGKVIQNIFFNQKNHVIDKIFHCFCFVPNEWDSFHQMARIEANVLICLVAQEKKSSASSKKHKSQRLQSWFVHICAERNIRTTTLRYCHLLLYLRWLLPKFFYDTLGG